VKLVFPVRFVDGARVVQTTAGELTESAVFVHVARPPAPGASLDLRLYLPDASEPVGASARAEAVEAQGERAGFSARFVRIHGNGQLRIGHILQVAFSTAARNLRAFQRVPVQLKALVATPGGPVEAAVPNLSAAGMFVQLRRLPPVAEVLAVMLQLPDGQPPASVTVQVVRHDPGAPGRPPGVGVQFVDATDEFRSRLDAYLRAAAPE
jgi:Tfp pilus assembly protein PilZ